MENVQAKRIPFAEFKSIYTRVPRLCVEVVCVRNCELLLIRRTIAPAVGKWHTPGGTVLKGESLYSAVKRVALEELGIEVVVKKFLGVIEYVSYENHYSQDVSLAFTVAPKDKSSELKFRLDANADKFGFFGEIPEDTIEDQKVFYSKRLKLRAEEKQKTAK